MKLPHLFEQVTLTVELEGSSLPLCLSEDYSVFGKGSMLKEQLFLY